MSVTRDGERGPRWWQGLDRYCWVVLAIAALGWLFDTMDQNLFNLVRAPSTRELLLHAYVPPGPVPPDARPMLGVAGKAYGAGPDSLLIDLTDRPGFPR